MATPTIITIRIKEGDHLIDKFKYTSQYQTIKTESSLVSRIANYTKMYKDNKFKYELKVGTYYKYTFTNEIIDSYKKEHNIQSTKQAIQEILILTNFYNIIGERVAYYV